jgi:c-di-GMP-binding flagellar brake protein YcgR
LTDLDFKPMRKGPPKPSDAVDRIGQVADAHDMRDAFDIGEALSTLAQTGEPVTVYSPQLGMAMARIDQVDTENDTFVIDVADGLHLVPGKTVFVAAMGGNAKIQFELDGEWTGLPDAPHLVSAPFPAVCRVLNRRTEQRLETPVGGSYSARFSLYNKIMEMALYDFSSGGVGFRASPEQAAELHVGKRLVNVQLELGPSLVVDADLEVRLLRPFRTFLLGPQVQVGCRISNISLQMRQNLDRAVKSARMRAR